MKFCRVAHIIMIFLAAVWFMSGRVRAAQAPSQADIDILRVRLEAARQAVVTAQKTLPENKRRELHAAIDRADQALHAYELAWHTSTRSRANNKPLYFAGIALFADDSTLVGAVDDVLIPIVALVILIEHLRNQPHVPSQKLARAWRVVVQRLNEIMAEVDGLQMSPYHPSPETLTGFPEAVRVRPKTASGAGKLRARWKLPDGTILEWDGQHGAVEKYTPQGKHLGEFDPKTGQKTKPAQRERKVEP